MKKIIDISWPIDQNTTEYKNRKSINISNDIITMATHTGTHIDSPAHFGTNKKTIDQIDLEKYIGPCQILDLTHIKNYITAKDLENFKIEQNQIILLKTENSNLNYNDVFHKEFIYLEKSSANYLAEKKIKAVGIDYLGIERNQQDHETHKILLSLEIPIIEGLRLKNVEPGQYQFICLPLNILGKDASPARAILIKN